MHPAMASAVEQVLPALTAAGFDETERQIEPTYFGRGLVTWTNQDAAVRLVCDNGQLFIDLRPSGSTEWFDLTLVARSLADGEVPAEAADPDGGQVRWFLAHFEEVLAAATGGRQKDANRRLKHARSG